MKRYLWAVALALLTTTAFAAGVVVGDKMPESSVSGMNDGSVFVSGGYNYGYQVAYATGAIDAFSALRNEVYSVFVRLATSADPAALEDNLHDVDPALVHALFLTYNRIHNTLDAIPVGTKGDQFRDVVTAYIHAHPAERHNNGALLVWRALADANWR